MSGVLYSSVSVCPCTNFGMRALANTFFLRLPQPARSFLFKSPSFVATSGVPKEWLQSLDRWPWPFSSITAVSENRSSLAFPKTMACLFRVNPIDRSSPSSSTYRARPPRARPNPSTSQSAKSSEHLRPPNAPLAMPNPKKHHALVFVRLAHDRRFVGAVLFLFVLVLFVFIRISGRHRVAHDHEGTPVDQPGGKFLGDVWRHVVAPRVWTLR